MDVIEISEGNATLRVSKQEIITLTNALNETRNAVEDWEFSTRIGIPLEEAEELRTKLKAVTRQMGD